MRTMLGESLRREDGYGSDLGELATMSDRLLPDPYLIANSMYLPFVMYRTTTKSTNMTTQ
jgi:hypothetical protein